MSTIIEKLMALGEKSREIGTSLGTEEATKMSLVLPLLRDLGYDTSDPRIVVPEFTSDVGTKKGEKVDFAILQDGVPIVLIECKIYGTDLENVGHNQLYRYFGVTDAKIGILTNGSEYRFYSDLDAKHKMDSHPFLIIDLETANTQHLKEFERFQAKNFSLDTLLSSANDLKFRRLVQIEIMKELENPSEDFVRHIGSKCIKERMTSTNRDRFARLIKEAAQIIIRDKVADRLSRAQELNQPKEDVPENPIAPDVIDDGIVTTEEEIIGYNIVRSIASEVVDIKRVFDRDRQSYFGILLDDNNRKPICRLYFNGVKKWAIGIWVAREEEKFDITAGSPQEIFKYKEKILASVRHYMEAEA